MKYQPLFSIILMFVFSACTVVTNVEPVTPTQPEHPPTVGVGVIAPVLQTQTDPYPIIGEVTPDSTEKGDDSGAATSIVPKILSEEIITMPVSSNLEKAKEDLARRFRNKTR